MEQAEILKLVWSKTTQIDNVLKGIKRGKTKSYGAAMALQKFREERKVLAANLDKPRLVWDRDNGGRLDA